MVLVLILDVDTIIMSI
uniref:Uncharacterized protein n=1 Tax=Rhizophora mucronata TaxID=61149 RepID=A0A2P2PYV8_RHIMU